MGRLFILLAAAASLVRSSLIDRGQVVSLESINYYVGGIAVGQLGSNCSKKATLEAAKVPGHDLFPMSIIETSAEEFLADELLNTTAKYVQDDDVFQPAFLKTIYLRPIGSNHRAVNSSALSEHLAELGTTLFISSGGIVGEADGFVTSSISSGLPKGPYFVSALTGNIFKAYRLYDDDYLAFIQGVISDEEDGFMSLPAITENVMAKSIAVPSRLYYTPTEDQPLAGLRFGVKDIFHVKGLATSGGNRAYFYLYGRQNKTAPCIQRLIDLGAVLIGKMGTVQFANGDRPTADWVDLHAPFNPRGDGYQVPSGSSSGPGAGIGAYEWLDLAVGSDTGGSMRGPAASQGIFGNRPSTGAISLEHVIPLSPVSDTAGMFARSGKLWAQVVRAWYPDFQTNYTSFPRSIYRSTALRGTWASSDPSPEAIALVETFVQSLEGFLGATSSPVNYTQRWSESHGDAPASLADMLYLTYGVFVSHDQWKLLGKPFFDDYAAKHDGRTPYINPGPLARWRWAQANAPEVVYNQGLRNISLFKNWWETEGYGRHDPESCSEGVYIYPWSLGDTAYRDEYVSAPTRPPLGFGDWSIPVMAGAPEVVVPIGEVPFNSTKSMHTEYLPVTMGIRMARGCDDVLARLVSDLEDAGVLRPVSAGQRLYP
ncbi:hypothetical protein TPAR_00117 [Tolypocladium paradoxum]|uniref:Uncharacterized protein n=1 Tax=Tolypocladium paradoxum TaxID=94208 RepID=A0A2S4LB83_9HYPO|nr:hypothetical protein TPAR_00117 [Tolypocladium paradoxum]